MSAAKKGFGRCGSSPAGLTLNAISVPEKKQLSASPSDKRKSCCLATEAAASVEDTATASNTTKEKAKPKDLTLDTLRSEWTIWFDKATPKSPSKKDDTEDADAKEKPMYDDCIVELGSFSTRSGLLDYWKSLRCEHLKDNCNLRVFRKGVRPLSTDDANESGGKWVVRSVQRARRGKMWLRLVEMLISDELSDTCGGGSHVTGGVMSTRAEGDSLQLWVGDTEGSSQAIATSLQKIFLDGSESFVYQPHVAAPQALPVQAPPCLTEAVSPRQNDPYGENYDEPIYSTWQGDDESPLSPTEGSKHVRGGGSDVQFMSYYQTGCMSPGARMQQGFPPASPPYPQQQLPYTQYGSPQQQPPMSPYQHMSPPQTPPFLSGPVISPVISPLHVEVGSSVQRREELSRLASNLTQDTVSSAVTVSNSGAGDTVSSDEESSAAYFAGGHDDSPAALLIQDRAKQIRTLKKKIRYINFYLQRQCKGRELTFSEKQRIKNLPLMQAELQALESHQADEVDTQKRTLGVEELDYLKKSQQPMQFTSESEKRYKTIRALKKKVRFIHYHLERKKQGKSLSQAEASKIGALPELEAKLKELELEEALEKQAKGEPLDGSDLGGMRTLGREQTGQSIMSDMTNGDEESEYPPRGVITNLQAQIKNQQRQLEMRQQRIQTLITRGPSPPPSGGQSSQPQTQQAPFPQPSSPQNIVNPYGPGMRPKTTQQNFPPKVQGNSYSPRNQYGGGHQQYGDYYGNNTNIIQGQPRHQNPMMDGYGSKQSCFWKINSFSNRPYPMPNSPVHSPPPLDSPGMYCFLGSKKKCLLLQLCRPPPSATSCTKACDRAISANEEGTLPPSPPTEHNCFLLNMISGRVKRKIKKNRRGKNTHERGGNHPSFLVKGWLLSKPSIECFIFFFPSLTFFV